MKRHLSEAEFLGWVAGERPSELERHIATCDGCREETAQMEGAIAGFRTAACDQAARQEPPVRIPDALPWWQAAPRWALAAAVLSAVAIVPAYKTYSARQTEARERVALERVTLERVAQDAADAALLQQVDAEVSRAVPAPMEPLASLASWTGASTGSSNE